MKENRNATEKINNTKSWFFENINTIDKLLKKLKCPISGITEEKPNIFLT